MLMKYLIKNFIIENVIDEIQHININDVENDVENIIDEIHYEFENVEIEIDDPEIVELFDLRNELKLFLINEIDVDDQINLINNYDDHVVIIENNNDEFQAYYNKKIDVDRFHHYNSNDDLILYKIYLGKFITINYHDVEKYYDVDDVVDEIFNNIL